MRTIIWILCVVSCCLASCSEGTSYYMDSIAGDDSNSGKSARRAWKTLERLNQQVFEPGDKILFKAGTEYTGSFSPKGSGCAGLPIIVDKYGRGEKPILNGDGRELYTIRLAYNTYWRISNLEIMNKGKEAALGRKGVWIQAGNPAEPCHIELRKLVIHEVMGINDSWVRGGAVYFSSERDKSVEDIIDVTLDSCYIYRCYPWRVCLDAPYNSVRMHENFIR